MGNKPRVDDSLLQKVIMARPCPYCGAGIGEYCIVTGKGSVNRGKPIRAIGQMHDLRLGKTSLKRASPRAVIHYE